MKLKQLTLYKYSLLLVKPLKMKGSTQQYRDGLIIELVDENGQKGLGDAAPFPGLHQESLTDIIKESKIVFPQLNNLEFKNYPDIWRQLTQLPTCSPSLQFALDWVFVDLTSKHKKITSSKLLNSKPSDKIQLNALLAGSVSEILRDAEKLKGQKYKAIKIKVATHAVEEDINLVLKLNDLFNGQVKLRLDANQTWTFAQAVTFGKAIQKANIEYLEEPCNDSKLFENFYNETGIPYVFDETLYQGVFNKLENPEGLSSIILKPSVIGRLSNIRKWTDWASQKGIKIVFSSAFESGIGLWAISNLTAALGDPKIAHGLDTFKWLKKDVIIPPFGGKSSLIDLKNQNIHLDQKNLNIIYEYNF